MIRLLPNIISLLRLVLLGPYMWWLIRFPHARQTLLLALLIIISDKIDGTLARRFKATSRLGSVLDAVSDFIFIVVSLIVFYFLEMVSGGILLITFAPRIAMLVSTVIYRLRNKKWAVEHFLGGRLVALFHYIFIVIVIANVPLTPYVLGTFVALIFLCAILGEYQRHYASTV